MIMYYSSSFISVVDDRCMPNKALKKFRETRWLTKGKVNKRLNPVPLVMCFRTRSGSVWEAAVSFSCPASSSPSNWPSSTGGWTRRTSSKSESEGVASAVCTFAEIAASLRFSFWNPPHKKLKQLTNIFLLFSANHSLSWPLTLQTCPCHLSALQNVLPLACCPLMLDHHHCFSSPCNTWHCSHEKLDGSSWS